VALWLRARRAGRQQFRFLFLYEPDVRTASPSLAATVFIPRQTPNKALPQRYLRRSAVLEVLPSLGVAPFVRPSFTNPAEYILGLQVRSLRCWTRMGA
jgi:hypothetical protein